MNIATLIICSLGTIAGFIMIINYLKKGRFLLYLLFVLLTSFNLVGVLRSIDKLNNGDYTVQQNEIKKENTHYQVVTTKTLVTPTDTVLVTSDTTYLRK